jgi:hypothetical protein
VALGLGGLIARSSVLAFVTSGKSALFFTDTHKSGQSANKPELEKCHFIITLGSASTPLWTSGDRSKTPCSCLCIISNYFFAVLEQIAI